MSREAGKCWIRVVVTCRPKGICQSLAIQNYKKTMVSHLDEYIKLMSNDIQTLSILCYSTD